MNKRLLVIIGLGLAVALGAGGFFLMNNRTESTTQNQETAETSEPKSFKSLLSLSGSQECNFEGEDSRGVMFVSSGKVRGDFESGEGEETTSNHMIIDDNTMYIWTEGGEDGIMMSLEQYSQPDSQTTQGSLDLDKEVDYECKNWVADDSKFVLPDIEFTDYSKVLNSLPTNLPQSTETSDGSQCSVCDSLSGDPKNQCLQTLGCN